MSFLEDIKNVQSAKLTENGAYATSTTGSYLVDIFGLAGSFRTRQPEELVDLFNKAMAEDNLLATKFAYYLRDVREGLGERDAGKVLLYSLAVDYPKTFAANIETMTEVGRYDDLVDILYGLNKNGIVNEATTALQATLKDQYQKDIESMSKGEPASLLGKWMPSINTSSKETKEKACMMRDLLGVDNMTYRKSLSSLREHLNVVERNISSKNYNEINYEAVPSRAMKQYKNAFERNDTEHFHNYLDAVRSGEQKINAGTLFPYDIVREFMTDRGTEAMDLAWKALPNYVDENKNYLIMADVSGSMSGLPMYTSVGLALYFAERNKGTFGNHFMTFSSNPELVEVKGDTLEEKINYISNADWGMNTDLEKAFDLILDTAVRNNTPVEDFPTSIVVISDMEIDYASRTDRLFSDTMKEKFANAGYEMPNLVYWNVDARENTFHAKANDANIQLVSGSSPTVFKTLCTGEFLTPLQNVEQTLNSPRYEKVVFVPNHARAIDKEVSKKAVDKLEEIKNEAKNSEKIEDKIYERETSR